MIRFKRDYEPQAVRLFSLTDLTLKQRAWVDTMDRESKLKEAIDELRRERAAVVKKLEELDSLIEALESRVTNRNGTVTQTIVLHNSEFANTGIAESAVTMIRRANKPLHVKDIAKGLEAGGYVFKTDNALNSVGPTLYLAAKNGKHTIVKKKGNVYSIKEIENRSNK